MKKLKGIIIFYINIGNLPPDKANEFILEQKANNNSLNEKLIQQNYESLWMPIREGHTRIEVLPL